MNNINSNRQKYCQVEGVGDKVDFWVAEHYKYSAICMNVTHIAKAVTQQ